MNPWEVLSTRVLLDRRWLRVNEERVLLPNGAVIEEFHRLESPDWVAVVPVTPGGDIVMVDQYRHGAKRTSRELPAGVIDAGETPIQAAKRELLEETGYTVSELVPLFALSPEPHRSTQRGHIFLGKNAGPTGEARPEPTEVLEVHVLPASEVVADALAGRIIHAVHVAAILVAHGRGLLA